MSGPAGSHEAPPPSQPWEAETRGAGRAGSRVRRGPGRRGRKEAWEAALGQGGGEREQRGSPLSHCVVVRGGAARAQRQIAVIRDFKRLGEGLKAQALPGPPNSEPHPPHLACVPVCSQPLSWGHQICTDPPRSGPQGPQSETAQETGCPGAGRPCTSASGQLPILRPCRSVSAAVTFHVHLFVSPSMSPSPTWRPSLPCAPTSMCLVLTVLILILARPLRVPSDGVPSCLRHP